MRFAVFQQPVTVIYEKPEMTKLTEKGMVSTIVDEGLYGMACQVVENQDGWAHVITHYGYAGYVRSDMLLYLTEEGLRERLSRRLAIVEARFSDVLSLPLVQGVCLAGLVGGSVIETLPGQCEETGWTKVRLLNGKEGYMRTQHLSKKRFSEDFLWKNQEEVLAMQKEASERKKAAEGGQEGFSLQKVLDEHFAGSEEAFRDNLVAEAKKYMGVQYRWGGKSAKGIDCSGLVSMAYMRSGILIYRDAAIADGYPIRRMVLADALEGAMKKGDLLYFPGHVAMYIGEGRFIHSTARVGSGGVVINSLVETDPGYRGDLRECLYAVGGVR